MSWTGTWMVENLKDNKTFKLWEGRVGIGSEENKPTLGSWSWTLASLNPFSKFITFVLLTDDFLHPFRYSTPQTAFKLIPTLLAPLPLETTVKRIQSRPLPSRTFQSSFKFMRLPMNLNYSTTQFSEVANIRAQDIRRRNIKLYKAQVR